MYFCVLGVSGCANKFWMFCMTSEFAVSSNVLFMHCSSQFKPEAEFLDVIGTKIQEFSSLLFTVTSTNGFPHLPLREQKWVKTGLLCKHCTGKLKSENYQDYAQKRNRRSENSQDYAQKLQRNLGTLCGFRCSISF
jgi:hypothetical protein